MEFKLILIEGDDIYLRDKEFKYIKTEFEKKYGKLVDSINYIKLENPEANHILSEIETPSFLSPEKLIIVSDFNFSSSNDSNINKIIEHIKVNKEKYNDVVLVFLENKKILATNKFKKYIKKEGQIKLLKKQGKEDIKNEIINISRTNNTYISISDIYYLIDSVGEDMQIVINEYLKVLIYKKSTSDKKEQNKAELQTKITREDIDLNIIKNPDAKLYEITSNMEKGKKREAINIINDNFTTIEGSLGLLSYLFKYYFDLYVSCISKKEMLNPEKILKLTPNRSFLLNVYRREGLRIGEERLKDILNELALIDFKSKTEKIDISLHIKGLLMTI